MSYGIDDHDSAWSLRFLISSVTAILKILILRLHVTTNILEKYFIQGQCERYKRINNGKEMKLFMNTGIISTLSWICCSEHSSKTGIWKQA